MKRGVRILLLLVGLALFGLFLHTTGWKDIQGAFHTLGWWGLLVLAPYGLVFTVDTAGWGFAFSRDGLKQVAFHVLWGIRLAGEAVNNVIPSMYVGGEATKVYLLHQRGVPGLTATSAAVRSKTAQSVAQSTFLVCGAVVAAYSLPSEQNTAKWIFGLLAAGALGVMLLLFALQSRGMTRTLAGVVQRMGVMVHWIEARMDQLRHLDEQIVEFYRRDRSQFLACTLTYFGGWMLDTVEILVASHLLGTPVEWHHAFAIEAFIGLARGFNTVVPGALGVQEFSVIGLFTLFGYPLELGKQYAVIRRGRDVVYTVLGWLLLYTSEASLRGLRERVRDDAGPTHGA